MININGLRIIKNKLKNYLDYYIEHGKSPTDQTYQAKRI